MQSYYYKKISKARLAGQNGYWDGRQGAVNPYQPETLEYVDWIHGWHDARLDEHMVSREEDLKAELPGDQRPH